MELTCPSFLKVVTSLPDSRIPVIATVALHGAGLIAQVKARDDVKLIEVAGHNREQLPEMLEAWLRQRRPAR